MRDGYLRGALSPKATQRQIEALAAFVAAGGSVSDAGLADAEIWRRARSIPGWESNALVAHEQAAAGQHMSLQELRRHRRR